jgi:hypothetical protein
MNKATAIQLFEQKQICSLRNVGEEKLASNNDNG